MSGRGALPIGIFDSGVGGLTVLRAVRRCLPGERYLYLGDTARLPYGTKSAGTIQRYALNAGRYLVDRGIKMLIVACNTASSYALSELHEALPVPVIGVVGPGVEAVLATGARRIAVIGTEGTVRSGAYQNAITARDPGVTVRALPCPLFVPLAEEGWGDHPVTRQVARIYLRPLLKWGAEALLLACTHYPLLVPSLAAVAGPEVQLVDSASAVASAVAERFRSTGRSSRGDVQLLLTDASDHFLRVARTILGEPLPRLELVHLDRGL